MKPQIISLNAKEAQKFLEGNKDNRAYSQAHVDFIANQMSTGKWKFTADPIKISKTGKLLDGQHRLLALIKAGKQFDFLVIKDLEDTIFDVLDTGKVRTAGDVLSINKVTKANMVASIAKFAIAFKKGAYTISVGNHSSKRASITNADVLKFARQNAEALIEAVESAAQWNKGFKFLSFQLIGGAYFIFREKHEQDADTFFERLANGLNLEENCPIRRLREILIRNSTNKSKLPTKEKLALMILAWNAFRSKKDVKILRTQADSKFPIPL